MEASAHAAQILTLRYLLPIPPSGDEVTTLAERCSQGYYLTAD